MDDDVDTDAFRTLLLERRAKLDTEAETGDEAARPVELDQTKVGRLSRMDALQAQAMAKEGERRRNAERGRIAAALERIEAHDYGYCLTCGDRVPDPRLRIDPAATQCVRCAETSGH